MHDKCRMLEGGTIEKRGQLRQFMLCHSKVFKHKTKCLVYGGHCPQDNFCPALENPRGGDFGWGECINQERD